MLGSRYMTTKRLKTQNRHGYVNGPKICELLNNIKDLKVEMIDREYELRKIVNDMRQARMNSDPGRKALLAFKNYVEKRCTVDLVEDGQPQKFDMPEVDNDGLID